MYPATPDWLIADWKKWQTSINISVTAGTNLHRSVVVLLAEIGNKYVAAGNRRSVVGFVLRN